MAQDDVCDSGPGDAGSGVADGDSDAGREGCSDEGPGAVQEPGGSAVAGLGAVAEVGAFTGPGAGVGYGEPLEGRGGVDGSVGDGVAVGVPTSAGVGDGPVTAAAAASAWASSTSGAVGNGARKTLSTASERVGMPSSTPWAIVQPIACSVVSCS